MKRDGGRTMSRFWSETVGALQPYSPGEQPQLDNLIKLNTNEHPYGPSKTTLDAIADATNEGLRLYPDPGARELRDAIASKMDLDLDHVFVGNGSDEVLAHSFKAFFKGKGPVQFADVTYSFYKTYCRLFDVQAEILAVTKDFRIDVGDYADAKGGVIIANPNAPTGVALGVTEIESVLVKNPDVVVIVDEAYVDFGAESCVRLVQHYDNLLVVQTLSKSRGLAGLRVGMAIGQPHLIEGLERVKDSFNSYPLDRLAQVGALAAWGDDEWFEQTCERIVADREMVADKLGKLGFETLPSSANFVFASHPLADAGELKDALKRRGILVRHFTQERIRNWLRISIGSNQDCLALLNALTEILEEAF